MRYFSGAFALFLVLTSVPLVSNAATAAELAAQAEALLQQVAALQAQLSAQSGGAIQVTGAPTTVVSSANCPLIGRVLKLGSNGDDVTRLQRFLAVDPSIYPEAMITGYYGALTEAAVKRWQTKYNIVSSGDAETTGFGVTGPRTAAAISLQCSTATSTGGGTSIGGTPTVGGFIQVTPVSGNAPLTVNVVATVNTVNSCQAATYTLDWGDGTVAQNIQVPMGNCGQLQQNYSHVYLYGGTYLIRLSSGQHSTSATVQVSGASGPSIVNTPASPNLPLSISLSSPAAGATMSQGATQSIAWSTTGTVPANSQIALDLYTSDGTKVGSTITTTVNISGTYQWQVPSVSSGTYKIRATLISGGVSYQYGESGTFTIGSNAAFAYGPLAITPGVQGSQFTVAASFNLPSSCTGYTLSWGDGTSSTVQAHSTACAQSSVVRTFTHQYASAGTYVITARRGENLSQVDSTAVVISN